MPRWLLAVSMQPGIRKPNLSAESKLQENLEELCASILSITARLTSSLQVVFVLCRLNLVSFQHKLSRLNFLVIITFLSNLRLNLRKIHRIKEIMINRSQTERWWLVTTKCLVLQKVCRWQGFCFLCDGRLPRSNPSFAADRYLEYAGSCCVQIPSGQLPCDVCLTRIAFSLS